MEKFTLWCAFSALFIITILSPHVESVACYSCESDEPCEPCSGDYCFIASLSESGTTRVVKGCSQGSFWKKKLQDSCTQHEKDAQIITNCVCSGSNYCNGGPTNARRTQLVTCACDTCGGATTCQAEYCAVWHNQREDKTTKGCLSRFVSQLRPDGLVSCEKPPVTGVHSTDMKPEELAETEQCLCSTNMCNEKKPEAADLTPATSSCRTQVAGMDDKGGFNRGGQTCHGQFCYNVTVTDSKSSKKLSQSTTTGCISLGKDSNWDDRFNKAGCQDMKSKEIQVRHCIEMPGGAAVPAPPPLPTKAPKPTTVKTAPATLAPTTTTVATEPPAPETQPTEPEPEPEPESKEEPEPESKEEPEPEEPAPETEPSGTEEETTTTGCPKWTATALIVTIASITALAIR